MALPIPEDILVHTEDLPWVELVPGMSFRLVCVNPQTGRSITILRAKKGCIAPRHRHLAPAEYYVLKGRMEYRAGTATVGTYGYEPCNIIHEATIFPEDTDLFMINDGPLLWLDDDGNPIGDMTDFEAFYKLNKAAGGKAVIIS